MYLSVQRAARRLGVSSHTVRRWTDSGFLPCIRTAGGRRRISSEDLDELAALSRRRRPRRRSPGARARSRDAGRGLDRPHQPARARRAARRDRAPHDRRPRLPLLRDLRLRRRDRHGPRAGRLRPQRRTLRRLATVLAQGVPLLARASWKRRSWRSSGSAIRAPTPPRRPSCATGPRRPCCSSRSVYAGARSACSKCYDELARAPLHAAGAPPGSRPGGPRSGGAAQRRDLRPPDQQRLRSAAACRRPSTS